MEALSTTISATPMPHRPSLPPNFVSLQIIGRSAPRPRPVAERSLALAPALVNRAPPPAPAQPSGGGGMFSGIGSTIAQGMDFGTESAVAHRAVDLVMGPRTIQHEAVEAACATPVSRSSFSSSCDIHSKTFQDCISSYGSEISKCQCD